MVVRRRTGCEARYENASLAFAIEPSSDLPGRRLSFLRQKAEPGTRHVLEAHMMLRSTFGRAKISDIVAVDFIGAQYARLDLVCEALVGFLDRRHHAERQV